jgi:hypothetical protein
MSEPRLCFTVVSEVLRGQQFVFDGQQPITIGRTPDNGLPLDHKSVSRRHARVDPSGDGFLLVDMGSHNGTRVGDHLVSKHLLRPGDVIGLGEIALSFALLDGAEAAAGASSALPVVAVPLPQQGMALARPVSFDEIYAHAGATQPVEVPQAWRVHASLLYALLLGTAVVLGLVGLWAVGRRPPELPVVAVQLRVDDVLPVNLAFLPSPDGKGKARGLDAVNSIGQPENPAVADARATRFKNIVTIRGKAQGETDIVVSGTPSMLVILRVLVRGVRPEPAIEAWRRKPFNERRGHAYRLIENAGVFLRASETVDENTWRVSRDLELASELLRPIPGESTASNDAAARARACRQALAKRLDLLSREIETLFDQGRLQECLVRARELKRIFGDPETEEYQIANAVYDSLVEEVARAERAAQENR